jgi:AcrR family transcriptional regulator
VLATALDLLARDGYGNLTMDAVAAAAHTSKATIYRQWGGKAGLVSAALGHLRRLGPDAPSSDRGSLRGDLLWLARTVGPMSEQQFTLMAALAHAARHDEELAARLRSFLFDPTRAVLEAAFARAVDRGEIPAGHRALEHLASVLIGAGLSRPLVEGVLPDEAYFVHLIDDVVMPLFAPPTTPRTRT